MAKLILDTTITNIFCKTNLENISECNISMFMAGKIGENMKNNLYKNKFTEKYIQGYVFKPLAFGITGGRGLFISKIVKEIAILKSKRTNQDKHMIVNNMLIELNCVILDKLLNTVLNHFTIE